VINYVVEFGDLGDAKPGIDFTDGEHWAVSWSNDLINPDPATDPTLNKAMIGDWIDL
jgi:hypothetical protein